MLIIIDTEYLIFLHLPSLDTPASRFKIQSFSEELSASVLSILLVSSYLGHSGH